MRFNLIDDRYGIGIYAIYELMDFYSLSIVSSAPHPDLSGKVNNGYCLNSSNFNIHKTASRMHSIAYSVALDFLYHLSTRDKYISGSVFRLSIVFKLLKNLTSFKLY